MGNIYKKAGMGACGMNSYGQMYALEDVKTFIYKPGGSNPPHLVFYQALILQSGLLFFLFASIKIGLDCVEREKSSSKSETSEISKTKQSTFNYTFALDFSLSESKYEETEEITPTETENIVTEALTEATVVSETSGKSPLIIIV